MDALSVLPEAQVSSGVGEIPVTGITLDSRQVRPGDLFVAIRGEKSDGLDYAAEAIRRGARAVISDREAPQKLPPVVWVRVDAPRRALALVASQLAGHPSEKLVLAGVTGTNGKTTTAMLLEALLARRHGRAGFLGTIGYRTGRRELAAPRTTPEAPELQRLLAEMVAEGTPAAAMEVSSHALALDRVLGCRFDLAVFTNLTRDHLDFHRDMDDYFRAKTRLFGLRKAGAAAVVNVGDSYGAILAGELDAPVVTYSALGGGGAADVRAKEVRCDLAQTVFLVRHAGESFSIASPLAGRFNVENLLAAAAAGVALKMSGDEIAAALSSVRRVPGRFERVETGRPYTVLVDYAHTPDALERLLSAIRDLTRHRILLVFGCGGDRDRGKRFPMGQIAGRMADVPILTSDNPRSEDPEAILSEVERGVIDSGAATYLRITDRREAIAAALTLADSNSVVVVAGKGHETTQVIGDVETPFDDRQVVRELIGQK
jgi:UDP-N-acetylmuramoyl-L-alanyl-D-glutamate--2,6-diaminopimelate ligase